MKAKPELIIGIAGYGGYIPKYRIRLEQIARKNKQDPDKIKNSLFIEEKSVPNKDEDSATIGIKAGINALLRACISPKEIGSVYVGSESHPYAVKPTSSIIGQALNIGNNYTAADLEFACKAGTAALQISYAQAKANLVKYSLAIGTDTAQAKPGDILEYSASSAGAAFIISNIKENLLAIIQETLSYTSDTPDFWRRNQEKYPEHTGKFTGEPAYFKHVITCTQNILEKTGIKPKDFDYVIFHQPNGKFPLQAGKKLGFTEKQLLPSLLVTQIGNSYSASSLISLTHILDIAKPEQKILLTSYGSGSGSDSFIINTTKLLTKKQKLAKNTNFYINNKEYIEELL